MTDMAQALDILCPLHLMLNQSGHIIHSGPTMNRLLPELSGRRFLEEFEVRRPEFVQDMKRLQELTGTRLQLRLRKGLNTPFKAVASPYGQGGLIIKLSFGIHVVEAVQHYALTGSDFDPTDMTVDMLYLVEAKSAAMQATHTLNKRLQTAWIAAEEQAFTDTLTGLKNRRALEHFLTRWQVAGSGFAIMHVDLDFFKSVNDTFGHAAGDHVLQEVAIRLLNETRENDIIARVGGDEFTLGFPDLTDSSKLSEIAGRLIQALEIPVPFRKHTCEISASIGVAISLPGSEDRMEDLSELADQALYRSKNAGRRQFFMASPDVSRNRNKVLEH